MTLKEAVEEARRLYPDLKLKATSARMWTARGLIPGPEKVESLGGSKGTVADYPEETPAQIAAAAWLQDHGRATQAEIAAARRFVVLNNGWATDDEAKSLINGFLIYASNGHKYRAPYEFASVDDARKALDVLWYNAGLELAKRQVKLPESIEELIHSEWCFNYVVFFSDTDPQGVQLKLTEIESLEGVPFHIKAELINPAEAELYEECERLHHEERMCTEEEHAEVDPAD